MSGGGQRGALLSLGALAGLLALAWYDSLFVAVLLGSVLGVAWLADWAQGPKYTGTSRLEGKVAMVTGANRGIGYHTTKGLVVRGAKVYMACRDIKAAERAKLDIEKETGVKGQLVVVPLDLASLASVRKCAELFSEKENKLHILVNNAGFAFHNKKMTEDGFEQVFQVNHLGSFLLTNLLLNKLKNAGGQARVVSLSSLMHQYDKNGIQFDDLSWEKTKFDSWKAYAQSKLATIYFMRYLGTLLKGAGVSTYSVHPGVVGTDIGAVYMDKIPSFLRPITDLSLYFMKSPENGAQTTLYCAIEPSLEASTGKYYADCAECEPSQLAQDDALAKKLWEVSMNMVGPIVAIPVRSDCPPFYPPPTTEPVQLIQFEEPMTQQKSDSSVAAEPVVAAEKEASTAKSVPTERSADEHVDEILVELQAATKSEKSADEHVEEILVEAALSESIAATPVQSQPPQNLLEEIKTFAENSLNPVKVSEPVSGVDLMKQELLVKSVATFNKSELNTVKTAEPMSGAEVVKQELLIKTLTTHMETFDRSELRHTEVVERNSLPDADTLRQERGKAHLLSGIESFQPEVLSPVVTKEPLTGAQLMTQEIVVKSVETFDRTELRSTTVLEKQWIPDSEAIQEERSKMEHLTGIEDFPADELKKVKTKEPLSGLELLKQELTQKAVVSGVESFSREQLKPTEAVEKIVLPDLDVIKEEKVRVDLLKGVEQGVALSPVHTKEPLSGLELLQQELLHQELLGDVASFSSAALRPTTTKETSLLPDTETIHQEKSHTEFIQGISSFDPNILKPVKTLEPLSGSELAVQEIARKEIGDQLITFDRSSLSETIATEKVVLPGAQEIQEEKRHLNLLQQVEDGVSLKRVETKEPASPVELARLELNKTEVEGEILQFDRSRLTPVVTEEKSFLAAATEELKAAENTPTTTSGIKGLKTMLLDKDHDDKEERERRSSSEEWEKVSTGEVDSRSSSDC